MIKKLTLVLLAFVPSGAKAEVAATPTLVYDMDVTYPRPELVQFERRFGSWRHYDGYYSYPSRQYRPHYWGPYWRRDPYLQYRAWRGW